MEESYLQYVDDHLPELVALLQELIRIPTVNPPGNRYGEMVQRLEEECRSLSLATQVIPVPEAVVKRVCPEAADYPRWNLLARWDVGAPRTLHVNAHYDVVPVSEESWEVDPFEGVVREGYLYGRGAGDMKGSIAAFFLALRALRELGLSPRVNVEWSLTPDEETGGALGAGYLAETGQIRGDGALSLEGGSENSVGCGHNGVLWLHVTVQGRAAHASRPHEGINALEKAIPLIRALQRLRDRFQSPERCYRTPSGAERYPTLNIGGVVFGSPGQKENTVPEAFTFSVDRRIPPNETVAEAEAELQAVIDATAASVPDLKVSTRPVLAIEPCAVDPQEPIAQSFARSVQRVRGALPGFSLTSGFTDLHYLLQGERRRPGIGLRGQGSKRPRR
ncbi:MAG: succinyl-diaminopimelate desuccinylase [Candidatus Poribacteria bacterium]|nr:MAG: succinyl-diaminopimelate desuccinylase [Candidatus Poribacteria bacterium]